MIMKSIRQTWSKGIFEVNIIMQNIFVVNKFGPFEENNLTGGTSRMFKRKQENLRFVLPVGLIYYP